MLHRVRAAAVATRFLPIIRCINLPKDVKYDQGPSYYVIPEIPAGNLKESVLDLDNIPKVHELAADNVFNGYSRILMESQLSMSKLSEALKAGGVPVSLSEVVQPLEELLFPLEHGFQILRSVSSYSTDPIWSVIVGRLFQKLKTTRSDYLSLDAEIYKALLTIQSAHNGYTVSEKAMLDALIDDCWSEGADISLAAAGLQKPVARTKHSTSATPTGNTNTPSPSRAKDDLEQLRAVKAELAREQGQFQAMVMATSSTSGHRSMGSKASGRYYANPEFAYLTGTGHIPIAESDLAASAPSWLPSALGGQQHGGHMADMKVNVASDVIVQTVLRHCSTKQSNELLHRHALRSNTQVRETVWLSWVQRASLRVFGGSTGQHASNDARMQDIRRSRTSLASLLGCKDWLSVVWRSQHTRSPVSADWLIEEVLEPLRVALQPIGQNEWHMLGEWASAHLDLPAAKLEAWDIDYVIEQYNHAATHAQLQTPVVPPTGVSLTDHVITLLDQLANLFQLRLIPDPNQTSKDEVHLRLLDSEADDQLVGTVILDLYEKPGRQPLCGGFVAVPLVTHTHLSETGITIRPKVAEHSVATILGTLSPSAETEGVKVQELGSIAAAFGKCLEHILPEAHHHSLVGLTACLAPDMQHLAGDVISMVFYNSVLRPSLSSQANEKTATPSTSPPNRIMALPLLRQLYEARFDLSLWTHAERHTHWAKLSQQAWDAHLPYAKHPLDSSPCSAVHLFGPNSQPGQQYQHVWRQVVLYDTLAALQEQGWPATEALQTPEVQTVLKRFRDVILASKDRQPPAELFRQFRGRDPSHSHLLHSLTDRSRRLDRLHTINHIEPSLNT